MPWENCRRRPSWKWIADFSHQPEDVPRLIAALEAGGDFFIGSRYVKGGKIPDSWGRLRKALSRWGNIFAVPSRLIPGAGLHRGLPGHPRLAT